MNSINKKSLILLSKYIFENISDHHFKTTSDRFYKKGLEISGFYETFGFYPLKSSIDFSRVDEDLLSLFSQYCPNAYLINSMGLFDFLFNGDWFFRDRTKEGFVKRFIAILRVGSLDRYELSTTAFNTIDVKNIYEY